jgi:hypothetical protein
MSDSNMRPWSTIAILCAVLAAPQPARAAPRADVEALCVRIRSLVADDRPETADELVGLVGRGLPPTGLAVLLDAARHTPRIDLLPVLVQLSTYRRPEIRARAFVARAELGGTYADRAVAQAADDLELGVRRLAVVLGRANPSPVTETVIVQLVERDAELAAELARDAALVPDAGPPAEPEPEPELEPEPPVPFSHVDPGTPEPIDADPLAPRSDTEPDPPDSHPDPPEGGS